MTSRQIVALWNSLYKCDLYGDGKQAHNELGRYYFYDNKNCSPTKHSDRLLQTPNEQTYK